MIVDSQFPDMVPKYQSTIRALGGGEVDFTINTHWHYDHADGNELLGEAGSWIVAHRHSREMMMQHNTINTVTNPIVEQAPYATAGLPVTTFDTRMEMYFNGEQVDLIHAGPAHTGAMPRCIFATATSSTWAMSITMPDIRLLTRKTAAASKA